MSTPRHVVDEMVDMADRIHAPSPTSAGHINVWRQHTLCGLALRACSDDITTPTIEDFERVHDAGRHSTCHECASIC